MRMDDSCRGPRRCCIFGLLVLVAVIQAALIVGLTVVGFWRPMFGWSPIAAAALFAVTGTLLFWRLGLRPLQKSCEELSALTTSIFESALDGIFVVDSRGFIESCTPTGAKMFGATPASLRGRAFRTLIPDSLDLAYRDRALRAKSGESSNRDVRRHGVTAHGIDGRFFAAELSTSSPVLAKERDRTVFSVRDVDEQRRSEQVFRCIAGATAGAMAGDVLASLVEHLAKAFGAKYAAIMEIDAEKPLEARNAVLYSCGEILHDHQYNLEGTLFAKTLERRFCFHPHGVADRFSLASVMPNDHVESFLGLELRGREGKQLGLIAVMHDLPMQQHHFDEWVLCFFANRVSTELERQRSIEELESARRNADNASRSKSEFLANMSHEIRTPMTAIIGFSDVLLQEDGLDKAPPQRREALEAIRRNGEHLLSLINDILDLSKIEAGKLAVEEIEVSPVELIDDVVSLMGSRAAEGKLELQVDWKTPLPVAIRSDPIRLRQILINLVGNSIKFTPEGGRICITVELVESEEGEVEPKEPYLRLSVRDTGIGMTSEQVARLFRPFTQADSSTTRRFGGTGLGLTISKRLASMLGGELSVESEPNNGTTFTLTVATGPIEGVSRVDPGARSATEEKSSSSVNHAPVLDRDAFQGLRVLLVEDGVDNQRLISFMLRKHDADVEVAENGRRAVERMSVGGTSDGPLVDPPPFDLILMDMQMPEMDGYEATELLRSKGCDLPIIALTAHAMTGERDKCLSAGCDDYLTKPINWRRFQDVVSRISGRTEARSDSRARPLPLPQRADETPPIQRESTCST